MINCVRGKRLTIVRNCTVTVSVAYKYSPHFYSRLSRLAVLRNRPPPCWQLSPKVLFPSNWGIMCPPAPSQLNDINFSATYADLFGSLEKIITGSPLPSNVINDVDPYMYNPSDLPDGVWYLVPSKENTGAQHGHWKAKGEACEIFSNSLVIGWKKTLEYYEGQVPHEHKTDWVMQEFSITRKRLSENQKAEDASLLCRVFLRGKQSPNHEKQMFDVDVTSKPDYHLTNLSVAAAKTDITVTQGSTSKPQVNNDDVERLTIHHEENPSEYDYISRGDYLELYDLDLPASPSSSSENSSCMTMSSDEYFDSLALLQELEPKNNQDMVKENAGYKYRFSTSHRPNEVVMVPGSLVSIKRSKSPNEEILAADCPMSGSAMVNGDLDCNVPKQAIRGQKRDYRDEGSSNSRHLGISSDSNVAVPKGKKKATGSRMKKLKKNYFCFFPF